MSDDSSPQAAAPALLRTPLSSVSMPPGGSALRWPVSPAGVPPGHGVFHQLLPLVVLATIVDIRGGESHRVPADEHSLDELVGILLEDHPVLECARLRLVSVDCEILRLLGAPRHEAPFQARR